MFAELGKTQLTHELLVMLMAEVAAIVNARPISALPSDPDDPQPLSPAMLLTMKTHPTGPPPGQFLPLTSTCVVVGGEFNSWRSSSGRDGNRSTCRACSPDESGQRHGGTCVQEMSSSCETSRSIGTTGHWDESWRQ